MKIGILTFHYAHNYGAVLQAYALKKYLSDLGHEVSVINYRNQTVLDNYPFPLKPMIRKKDILFPNRWNNLRKEIIKTRLSKKDWIKQYEKFEVFINEYLENHEEWRQTAEKMDVIFFGSDQIWEKNITGGYDSIYLGYIRTKAIKASYAASCFSVNGEFSETFTKGINNFDYISVREESLANALAKFSQKSISTVTDPVLLLNKEDYFDLLEKDSRDRDYVLFYYVSDNAVLRQLSEYLRNEKNVKVIEIHYFRTPNTLCEWQRTDVGPEEFLSLIWNANQVFTNSFHGTAFSVLFEKQFYTVSQNMRVLNLLEKLELTHRNVKSLKQWKKDKGNSIDYNEVNKNKEIYLRESKNYITKILETDKKGD